MKEQLRDDVLEGQILDVLRADGPLTSSLTAQCMRFRFGRGASDNRVSDTLMRLAHSGQVEAVKSRPGNRGKSGVIYTWAHVSDEPGPPRFPAVAPIQSSQERVNAAIRGHVEANINTEPDNISATDKTNWKPEPESEHMRLFRILVNLQSRQTIALERFARYLGRISDVDDDSESEYPAETDLTNPNGVRSVNGNR